MGCLTGCLTKLVMFALAAGAFVYVLMVAMNPWALHIGGRSTPFLYWHGAGTLVSEDGRSYPLYVGFTPGRPSGFSGGGRRGGKIKNADLSGTGWLCIAPSNILRMKLDGDMYGGYTSDSQSLLSFRLLERTKVFSINPDRGGFFDLAGAWHGQELVMDRPGEQGIRLSSGVFIHHATVTLRWASFEEFEAQCQAGGRETP